MSLTVEREGTMKQRRKPPYSHHGFVGFGVFVYNYYYYIMNITNNHLKFGKLAHNKVSLCGGRRKSVLGLLVYVENVFPCLALDLAFWWNVQMVAPTCPKVSKRGFGSKSLLDQAFE